MQLEAFPNKYGACKCTHQECLDVFQLCSVEHTSDLFDSAVSTAPTIIPNLPYIVYSFNGRNDQSNNWITISSNIKNAFLERTNNFTLSFWVKVESSSKSSYLITFEADHLRYFSLYESSNQRIIIYFHRDLLDGFTSKEDDDGYNTQVGLSFYFDRSRLPTGLRDSQWHFLSLSVSYPNIILMVDGIEYRPTRGNYRNHIEATVDLPLDGSVYTMPAPILTKTDTQIRTISGRIGGSFRGNKFSLFGEMRQVVFSSRVISSNSYTCLASCNNIIGLDLSSSSSFPQFQMFYNPVTRTFQFEASTDAVGYTNFLQSLVYFTNGFLPPQETRESRLITIRISDEQGIGNMAQVNLIGRSNQYPPVLVASGRSITDINFQIDFTEDEDEVVQILSPQAFITDPDIDSIILNVTVNLTNPQNGNQESILLLDNPPSLLNMTNANGQTLTVGDSSNTILIQSLDTSRVSDNRFITSLVFLRYRNTAEEPSDVDRIIEFTVSDGRYVNNPKTVTTINMVTTNDVPRADLNGPMGGVNSIVTYNESSPPLNIILDFLVVDPDSPQMTHANARIEQVFDQGNETLSVNALLLPAGLSCIPTSCNATEISIVGSGSQSDYQFILRSLQYVNEKELGDLPNLRDRRIFVTISDGVNSSDPQANIIIDIFPVNQRVLIELDAPSQNYFSSFVEAQANHILCSSVVRVLDFSLDTLESVVVSIRDVLPKGVIENEESISLTSTNGLDVSIEINTALKRITFSQVAPISQYVEAIKRIQYFNGELEPILVNRSVDFLIIPGGGAPSDTSVCNILIMGINDNVPQCPALDSITVAENASSGYEIIQLMAIDLDQGVDGHISYKMPGGNTSPIDVTAMGLVRVIGQLDHEDMDMHSLHVEACDGGTPQFCCQINFTLLVEDFNDNPPVFNSSLYSFELTENVITVLPQIIFTSDADEGVNSDLSLVEIDPHSFNVRAGCFDRFTVSIDRENIISLSTITPGLDFEVSPVCSFKMVAYDNGDPRLSSSTMVVVNVTNVDDFSPEFSLEQYSFAIEEENNFNLVLGMVIASDRDSPTLTYLQSGFESLFGINATTGEVSILFSSDRNVGRRYTFTAIVSDPPGNMDTALIVINIIPINNDPPILDLNVTDQTTLNAETPFVYVEEGPAVTLLVEPLVIDPDDLDFVITRINVHVINSGNPSTEVLSIAADQAEFPHIILVSKAGLLVIEPLNMTSSSDIHALLRNIAYSNTEDELSDCKPSSFPCTFGPLSRTLTFSVFDGRFSSTNAEVYIQFEVVNDPPFVDLDSAAPSKNFDTVFREQNGEIPIVNKNSFSIMDEDNLNLFSLTCLLTNPFDSDDEAIFLNGTLPPGINLLPQSFHLRFIGSADISSYETVLGLVRYVSRSVNPNTTNRIIEVSVSDGMLTSSISVATVSFFTRNDPPLLDLDSLSDGNGFSVNFKENGNPVNLSRDPSVTDVDSTGLQQLVATIRGGSEADDVLFITQSIPDITLTIGYVYPNLTVIGLATIAVYEDIIASIRYENTADEIDDVSSKMVDFFIIDASGESSALPVTTVINIVPVDDNPPVFVPNNIYHFSVGENSLVPSLVGTVTVLDADLPSNTDLPIFSIINAVPVVGFSDFLIQTDPADSFQGQIYTNGLIDFEQNKRYTLAVEVQSANRSMVATVFIAVTNLADIAPEFSHCPPMYIVTEHELFATPLTPPRCTAIDPDDLDQITYSIDGNIVGGNNLIAINPTTGDLTVVDTIDREIFGVSFMVHITASDSTQFTDRTVTVVIQGVNEHDPVIDPGSRFLSVQENSLLDGVALLRVMAHDQDEVPDLMADPEFSSRITFRISAVNPAPGVAYFSINSTSGDIMQLLPIDYELFQSFALIVVASDNDATIQPRLSSIEVTVAVTNINDEPPMFINLPQRIIVSERYQVRHQITVIQFSDSDIDSRLSVSFVPHAPSNFLLTSISGVLSVNQPLDAEVPRRVFAVMLQLRDLNTDARYNASSRVFANTTIVIEDANDNSPMFDLREYTGMVFENSPAGFTVLNVSASDADYGVDVNSFPNGNSRLTYFFLGSDAPPSNTFAIDHITGAITKLHPLNRENIASFTFTVLVRDNPASGDLANSDTATVTINIQDINEFPPVPDPAQYFAFVSESSAIGTRILTYAEVAWNISREYMTWIPHCVFVYYCLLVFPCLL